MNKLLLRLVMLPAALWQGMGADAGQLKAILDAKLTMDDRKPMGFGRQRQKKDRKHTSLLNMLIYIVFGAVYVMPIAVIEDRILSLTIYFSLLLGLLTLMLVTDFANVIFDARDKYILFPRPVNDRTVVLARMLHVFIYLLRIILPLSLPGWIVLGYFSGWKAALLFPLPLLLMIVMALFMVNAIYLIVLQVARPEKFKDVINYFQILTSIVFFASFYLLPRFFDSEHVHDYDIHHYAWVQYSPSYWLAVCWSWVGSPVYLTGTGLYSILAIVVPLGCMFALVKWLAPQFTRKIAGIDAADITETKAVKARVRSSGGKYYNKLATTLNRTDEARAGFILAWLQTSRSRSFRMRVLPSFALILIYCFYLLTQHHRSFSDALASMHKRPVYLFLLYYSSFVMISAMNYVNISDQYKAAWVYYSAPLAMPGRVMSGALKALWVKYYLPFSIIIAAFILYVWGASVWIDILLALVNVTLFIATIARISHRHLPFSIAEQMKQGGARIMKSFLVMLLPIGLGGAHFVCVHFHLVWLEMIFIILSAILLWLVWDSYANTTWDNVIRSAEEG